VVITTTTIIGRMCASMLIRLFATDCL
jgi:ankyrin repeat protein